MLLKILILFVSVAALFIVCWMLTEYWLRSVRKFSREKISNLSIWNRVVFALEDFCGAVNRKKDFRRMKAGEELSSVHIQEEETLCKTTPNLHQQGTEKEKAKQGKQFNMKINM